MTKAVIFDVDGTLLNTERIYMRAWKEAGKAAGFTITDEVLLRTRAISRADATVILQEALGQDFSYDALYPVRLELSEAYIAQSRDLLMPGVAQALEALRSRGIPMAVASSTNREKTVSHLEHAGLLPWFDAVVGGDMVTRGKPNPDIFLLAAQMLGQEPAHCMVVEDTPAGIRAAIAAGMQPVLIPDCVKADPSLVPHCRAVLESMAQLPGLLDP